MRLLSIPEVAQRLGVRNEQVYRLARKQALPVVHVGRLVRVDEVELARWVAAGGWALGSAARDET